MAGWIQLTRGQIYPWECDQWGHLNTRNYVARFDEAGDHVFLDCGISFNTLRERDLALVSVRYTVQFRQELLAGAMIRIDGALLGIGNKSTRTGLKMLNAESGGINATLDGVYVLIDDKARRSVTWPDDLRAKLVERVVSLGEADKALFPD